jgi:hypothetical protein
MNHKILNGKILINIEKTTLFLEPGAFKEIEI